MQPRPSRSFKALNQPEVSGVRLFFAVWPSVPVARSILRVGEAIHRLTGGRLTIAESIHLTLAFLGEVTSNRLVDAIEAGRQIVAVPFTLTLNVVRYWPHNRLVWIGPRAMPSGLAGLAGSLRINLASAGFALESRPFNAHVTLIRNTQVDFPQREINAIEWRVDEFVLIQSEFSSAGVRYRIVDRFPLVEHLA